MPYKDTATQREYQRVWMATRRAQWMAGRQCADCGGTHRLQLHHADPPAKVSHRIWGWRLTRREAEASKCVVLCNDCHKRKHYPMERRHGFMPTYRAGCRCVACLAANAQRRRLQRAAARARMAVAA